MILNDLIILSNTFDQYHWIQLVCMFVLRFYIDLSLQIMYSTHTVVMIGKQEIKQSFQHSFGKWSIFR